MHIECAAHKHRLIPFAESQLEDNEKPAAADLVQAANELPRGSEAPDRSERSFEYVSAPSSVSSNGTSAQSEVSDAKVEVDDIIDEIVDLCKLHCSELGFSGLLFSRMIYGYSNLRHPTHTLPGKSICGCACNAGERSEEAARLQSVFVRLSCVRNRYRRQ